MTIIDIVYRGLGYATQDYADIATSESFDVKPKEDQIKCALYRAFSEEGYLVHVEAGYARNGGRCDLMAINSADGGKVAIEIKTAWGGGCGWVNKPMWQAASWQKDVEKLRALQEAEMANSGLFVLCFAYECESHGERQIREMIDEVNGVASEPFEINSWNGLNRIQFIVCKVFG